MLTARATGDLKNLFEKMPEFATVVELDVSSAPRMSTQQQEVAAKLTVGTNILIKPGEMVINLYCWPLSTDKCFLVCCKQLLPGISAVTLCAKLSSVVIHADCCSRLIYMLRFVSRFHWMVLLCMVSHWLVCSTSLVRVYQCGMLMEHRSQPDRKIMTESLYSESLKLPPTPHLPGFHA